MGFMQKMEQKQIYITEIPGSPVLVDCGAKIIQKGKFSSIWGF